MILIAEDDPDDQFLIQTVAKEVCPPETKMHFVEDGVELLDFLTQEAKGQWKPSLIMLDLNMPRKDGREVLKAIKADPELAEIPTVILTTSNIEDDVRYCHRFDIAGYFRKPSSIPEMREIIGGLCAAYIK